MSTKSPDITLHPVDASGADILTSIHRECFSHYWNIEAFSDFFSVSGTHALIARAGEPVAMMVYRVQHEQADIITLCVLPRWRKQGVARRMLEAAMENAALQGAKEMFLDVEDGNAAALALYEAFGFKHINRRKLYYRQKDGSFTDALVMARKLA